MSFNIVVLLGKPFVLRFCFLQIFPQGLYLFKSSVESIFIGSRILQFLLILFMIDVPNRLVSQYFTPQTELAQARPGNHALQNHLSVVFLID